MSSSDQSVHQIGTDETGATGDKHGPYLCRMLWEFRVDHHARYFQTCVGNENVRTGA
jgi:hypothetical protein